MSEELSADDLLSGVAVTSGCPAYLM